VRAMLSTQDETPILRLIASQGEKKRPKSKTKPPNNRSA
jgi:hypothetical protein